MLVRKTILAVIILLVIFALNVTLVIFFGNICDNLFDINGIIIDRAPKNTSYYYPCGWIFLSSIIYVMIASDKMDVR